MLTLRTLGRKLFVVVTPGFLCESTAACGQCGHVLLAAVDPPVHVQGGFPPSVGSHPYTVRTLAARNLRQGAPI